VSVINVVEPRKRRVSFREPVSFRIEPVCGIPKRKLENGEQRPAPQNLGFGPEILKIRR
jgi:hypothetical protein